MTQIIGIDPGKITGIVWGWYSDTEPFEIRGYSALDFDQLSEVFWNMDQWEGQKVIERYVPQSGVDYTPKEDDLAGVEVIGMIRHMLSGDTGEIFWHLRSDKAGIKDYDALLKRHGLWKTGADVNWTDGRDVNDATIHILEHLRKTGHRPTLNKYFRG